MPNTGHNIGRAAPKFVSGFFRGKLINKKQIRIKTVNQTEHEKRTKNKLDFLLNTFDLSKWIFTNKVLIKEGLRSNSHQVLTIATQHFHDGWLFLVNH